MTEEELQNRKTFIKKSCAAGIYIVAGMGLVGCKGSEEGQEVSPVEDLMQEHGLLNRILLVYDACYKNLVNQVDFPSPILYEAANIIRTFVEDYHEKQEEQALFSRFRKANVQLQLVKTLEEQHKAGRGITEQVLVLSKSQEAMRAGYAKLAGLLSSFTIMYRPHEAREDTVLFPAFRKLVSKHEYESLAEDFEKREHQLFGEDGFEHVLARVAKCEDELGIGSLEKFTPGSDLNVITI